MITKADAQRLVALMERRDALQDNINAYATTPKDRAVCIRLPIGNAKVTEIYLSAGFLRDEIVRRTRLDLATLDLRIAELNNKIKGGKA